MSLNALRAKIGPTRIEQYQGPWPKSYPRPQPSFPLLQYQNLLKVPADAIEMSATISELIGEEPDPVETLHNHPQYAEIEAGLVDLLTQYPTIQDDYDCFREKDLRWLENDIVICDTIRDVVAVRRNYLASAADCARLQTRAKYVATLSLPLTLLTGPIGLACLVASVTAYVAGGVQCHQWLRAEEKLEAISQALADERDKSRQYYS